MVNRVFCYSKEIAKQNGNKLPIVPLILSGVLFFVALFVVIIVFSGTEYLPIIMSLLTFGFTGLIIYYSVLCGLRLRPNLSAWATTQDGRIYKVTILNRTYYNAGVQISSMNRSSKIMSNPDTIVRMIEALPNFKGAGILEILNVYSITENKKNVRICCDYKVATTGKLYYRQNIKIEKAYYQFDQLIQILNTHKQ